MAVDLWHRYSNESERANKDIYDDFKLKKLFGFHDFHKKIQRFKGYTHINSMSRIVARLSPDEFHFVMISFCF